MFQRRTRADAGTWQSSEKLSGSGASSARGRSAAGVVRANRRRCGATAERGWDRGHQDLLDETPACSAWRRGVTQGVRRSAAWRHRPRRDGNHAPLHGHSNRIRPASGWSTPKKSAAQVCRVGQRKAELLPLQSTAPSGARVVRADPTRTTPTANRLCVMTRSPPGNSRSRSGAAANAAQVRASGSQRPDHAPRWSAASATLKPAMK